MTAWCSRSRVQWCGYLGPEGSMEPEGDVSSKADCVECGVSPSSRVKTWLLGSLGSGDVQVVCNRELMSSEKTAPGTSLSKHKLNVCLHDAKDYIAQSDHKIERNPCTETLDRSQL